MCRVLVFIISDLHERDLSSFLNQKQIHVPVLELCKLVSKSLSLLMLSIFETKESKKKTYASSYSILLSTLNMIVKACL